jgi:hypothetical protein
MDLKIGGPWLISHQPAVLFSQNELATTTSQQYFSLRRNQHQPSAISQPNRLNSSNIWDVAADVEEQVLFQCATFSFNIINVCRVNPPTFVSSSTILVVGAIVRGRMSPLHRVCERARYDHCRRGAAVGCCSPTSGMATTLPHCTRWWLVPPLVWQSMAPLLLIRGRARDN